MFLLLVHVIDHYPIVKVYMRLVNVPSIHCPIRSRYVSPHLLISIYFISHHIITTPSFHTFETLFFLF